jgi:hypothetical protein
MVWPPLRRVRWRRAWRLLPARYPPIQLFERLADPADWEALADIESLTNPRIRDEIGEIHLVPKDERVSGPGAGWVMASFVHVGRPSRFSDGRFGVYSCCPQRDTAIAETAYHMGRFYAATKEPALDVDMRTLAGTVDATFHDLRDDPVKAAPYLDPDSYQASQALGLRLRTEGSQGIVYPSVRHRGHDCLGALRPRAVSPPKSVGYLRYHWDGARIVRYFDYASGTWDVPPA